MEIFEFFKKFFEAIITLIEGVILLLLIAVIIGFGLYQKTGQGIAYKKYDNYQSIVVSVGDYVRNWTIGNFPEANETNLELKHKKDDIYYQLTVNEQNVYNAVLTRAWEIMNNKTSSTLIKVPLKYMFIEDLGKRDTYEEIEEKINKTLNEIDYKKVYQALHNDYGYLVWWEYDANWKFSQANIKYNNGDFGKSSFELILTPAECYQEGEHGIQTTKIKQAILAYNKAKEIADSAKNKSLDEALLFFKNKVIELTNYDRESSNNMLNGVKNEAIVSSRNFINIFDDNNKTNSICGGYSNAFQLLCDLYDGDFKCYTKDGNISTPTEEISHSWNVVIIDNNIYLADITNSDSNAIGQNGELFMHEINWEDEYSVWVRGNKISYYSWGV